jgi:PilZ domain
LSWKLKADVRAAHILLSPTDFSIPEPDFVVTDLQSVAEFARWRTFERTRGDFLPDPFLLTSAAPQRKRSCVMRASTVDRRRVLVIESETVTAADLQHWLRSDLIDVEVVPSADHALTSMTTRPADLVMTSTLLPPWEEALLTTHVRSMSGRQPQIINVPYFIDGVVDVVKKRRRGILSFFGWRRSRGGEPRPQCNIGTLRRQLADYLRESAIEREPLVDRLEGTPMGSQLVAVRAIESGFIKPVAALPAPSVLRREERRAAPRKRLSELSWLTALRVPHASGVEVVDISRTGMLIETGTKLTTGSSVEIELVGPDLTMRVPARMLRTQIASVAPLGMRYRIAAAFARALDMPGLVPGGVVGAATTSELLQKLRDALDRRNDGDPIARFESELKTLLRLREAQIRSTPMDTAPGVESVYFTVWTGASTPPVLQAVFEAGHQPTEMEFKVLKAAAGLAAAVLPFATGRELEALTA